MNLAIRIKENINYFKILAQQFSRFAVVGFAVTLINLAIYQWCVSFGRMAPNMAWIVGFFVATIIAFTLHNRWSFEAADPRLNKAKVGARFFAGALVNLALNSFWVWLLTQYFGLPVWSPYPLIIIVSPVLSFWFNRSWVFK
jgi:putative flippase GtrA